MLLLRDKTSLDLFWLEDASRADLKNLPEPEVLADQIMENLRSALISLEAGCRGLASLIKNKAMSGSFGASGDIPDRTFYLDRAPS